MAKAWDCVCLEGVYICNRGVYEGIWVRVSVAVAIMHCTVCGGVCEYMCLHACLTRAARQVLVHIAAPS